MKNWVLSNGQFIVAGKKRSGRLYVQGNKIVKFIATETSSGCAAVELAEQELLAQHSFEEFDCHGAVVGPGFIDLHVHGGGGADVMDANIPAYQQLAMTHALKGTTRLLLTTVTAAHDHLLEVCSAYTSWLEKLAQDESGSFQGAYPLGIHLEGPYIAHSKKGAQNGEYIRPFSIQEFEEYQTASNKQIRLITLAPEQLADLNMITQLTAQGIVVSIGHTEASYEEVDQAVKHGASHFTHLCNAMPTIHHRAPGPIAYALNHDETSVELIADGLHVHPAIIQLALRAKNNERVAIVTDAIRATGMPDGSYDLGGLKVKVAQGKATLDDETLAGSCLDMETAYQYLQHHLKLGDVQLFQIMSTTPAQILGIAEHFGTIAEGKTADLVLIKAGQVVGVMVNGSWIKGENQK